MKPGRITWQIVCLIILVLFNILLLVRLRKKQDNPPRTVAESGIDMDIYVNEGFKFKDGLIETKSDSNLLLSDLLEHNPGLILFVPNNYCDDCLKQFLGVVPQVLHRVDPQKVFVATNIEDPYNYLIFESVVLPEYRKINLVHTSLPKAINEGRIMMFYLNASLETRYVYFPNEYKLNELQKYLQILTAKELI